jgi:hypothetical protein
MTTAATMKAAVLPAYGEPTASRSFARARGGSRPAARALAVLFSVRLRRRISGRRLGPRQVRPQQLPRGDKGIPILDVAQ